MTDLSLEKAGSSGVRDDTLLVLLVGATLVAIGALGLLMWDWANAGGGNAAPFLPAHVEMR